MNSNKEVLMVFVKKPELGKAKTRLARTVGNEKALEVYKQLLAYTKSVLDQLPQPKQVHYAAEVVHGDLWDSEGYRKFKQQPSPDLGDRMKEAFAQNFSSGVQKIVLVGSDCPELSEQILVEAFEALDQHDVVFGPAEDGGYYLVGMRQPVPQLFENKTWSTDSVLRDSLADCKQAGLSWKLLPTLSDVDTEKDWRKFEQQLSRYAVK